MGDDRELVEVIANTVENDLFIVHDEYPAILHAPFPSYRHFNPPFSHFAKRVGDSSRFAMQGEVIQWLVYFYFIATEGKFSGFDNEIHLA
jgi:hypothetical protein